MVVGYSDARNQDGIAQCWLGVETMYTVLATSKQSHHIVLLITLGICTILAGSNGIIIDTVMD